MYDLDDALYVYCENYEHGGNQKLENNEIYWFGRLERDWDEDGGYSQETE